MIRPLERWQPQIETLQGESLKTAAEQALHYLGSTATGQKLIEAYTHNDESLDDPRLHTQVGSLSFENPLIVGAGWDKKGRAVHGLHALGFAGVEVGSVLAFPQSGNPKPRLWTIDDDHSVGLNRLGFNSPGVERVAKYLNRDWPLPCPIGINVGRNKDVSNENSVVVYQRVIDRLRPAASWIALGISSPNTADLRASQDKALFRDLVVGSLAVAGNLPVYAKIDAERSLKQLDDMVEVALETGLTGFIATNTLTLSEVKRLYGVRWAKEAGGLSGADPTFRALSTATIRHIYEQAGDKLEIMGVGGISDVDTALDKLQAGASALQIVTAIRGSNGRVAAQIKRDLLTRMDADGVKSVMDYTGVMTSRGAKTD